MAAASQELQKAVKVEKLWLGVTALLLLISMWSVDHSAQLEQLPQVTEEAVKK